MTKDDAYMLRLSEILPLRAVSERPPKPGVYAVWYSPNLNKGFSRWDGKTWSLIRRTKKDAHEAPNMASHVFYSGHVLGWKEIDDDKQ